MNNLKMKKYYFIAAAIALMAVFVAAPAGATGARDLNWKFRGDYTYNAAATCANAVCGQDQAGKYDCGSAANCCVSSNKPANCDPNVPPCTWGFNPATLALRVPGSQKSYGFNVQGVINFDGHGNWTLKGEILVIRTTVGINPPDIPANQSDLDVAGTYVVDSVGNGLFVDITWPTYTVTLKSGVVLKFSGPITSRGRLDTVTGSSTVIISQTIPEIEEQEIIVAPLTSLLGMKEQRICGNIGTIVQLSPRKNWLSKE